MMAVPAQSRDLFTQPNSADPERARQLADALGLGQERLQPHLGNPHYLILRHRRRLFEKWLSQIEGNNLDVLDIGGRIQPYRPLLEGRLERYVALDPEPTALVDTVGVGENLPFPDDSFHLVICSQVLSYVQEPSRVTSEIHRVLKPGGALLLSAPALCPQHTAERWRFLPGGLGILLACFSQVEIAPEGYSVAGICRSMITLIDFSVDSEFLNRVLTTTVFPLVNLFGRWFDWLSFGNERFTVNYSVLARKEAVRT